MKKITAAPFDPTELVIPPGVMSELLANAPAHFSICLALAGFAGPYPYEIIELKGTDIKLESRVINMLPKVASRYVQRIVPISENLVEWLAREKYGDGPVWQFQTSSSGFLPGNLDDFARNLRKTITNVNIAREKAKVPPLLWKRNMLRRSYGYYRYAQCQELARVAVEMGTNPAGIMFRHFGPTAFAMAEAKAWFSLVPGGKAVNIAE